MWLSFDSEQLIVLIILYSIKQNALVSVKNEYLPNLAANQKQNQTNRKKRESNIVYLWNIRRVKTIFSKQMKLNIKRDNRSLIKW